MIKNWSYLLASDVTQSIISFFVFMFLARKLSPEGFGTLNAILALASLFSVFAMNLSANQVITREVTLYPEATNKIFRLVLPIRTISLVLTIISLIIYQFHTGDGNTGLLIASSIIVVATLIWDLAESIAFGHFITKYTTLISIAASFCWLLIILFLPTNKITVEDVTLIYALILLLRSVVYFGVGYKKLIIPNRELVEISWKAILIMSLPYFWMRIVGALGEQVPILLLKGCSGSAQVGFYAVGNRFIMPITLAVTTGLRAIFPFMTKTFQEDKEKFNANLIKGFTIVLISGSTIAMLLTLSSVFFLPLFFGNAYADSVLAFNYQAWFGVLLCFDLLLSTVLSSTYRQKTLAIITTIDVLIVFPLMYFGARHGAEGMAIAKLFGSFIAVFYHIFVVVKVLNVKLNTSSFAYSCIYFLVLMLLSIFILNIYVKSVIIGILIVLYSVFKDSPLRQLFSLFVSYVRPRI